MAVDYCIENDILAKVLLKHKAEVKNMLFREFGRKEQHQLQEQATLIEKYIKILESKDLR